MDGRERKLWRRAVARQRAAKERRAKATLAEQLRREIDRQLRGWTRRRVVAWGLIGAAVVIAAQHVVAHGGLQPIPLPMGAQDLLIGYPMAGLLVIVGAILLGGKSAKP